MSKNPFLSDQYQDLAETARQFKEKYNTNPPFPNIAFQEFFNPDMLRKVLSEFPDIQKTAADVFYDNPNEQKYATKGEYRFGPYTKEFAHFLNSQPFLEFLQELTGIKETLIPDPYFEGGGFHQIKPGGFLKLHVDFHQHKKMKLDRRLNILVYLNENWEESYGGHFELWEKDMSKRVVRIAPLFNTLAMFSTTDNSWHGHPDPLTCPPDRSRKSLALYYYTNGRTDIDNTTRQRITTTFAHRDGQDSGKMKWFNRAVNAANDFLPPVVVRMLKKNTNK
jgi:Rps23 Pro-64 3,4-dihydroxylase Tpa1-like proline 4-hydroxylase